MRYVVDSARRGTLTPSWANMPIGLSGTDGSGYPRYEREPMAATGLEATPRPFLPRSAVAGHDVQMHGRHSVPRLLGRDLIHR